MHTSLIHLCDTPNQLTCMFLYFELIFISLLQSPSYFCPLLLPSSRFLTVKESKGEKKDAAFLFDCQSDVMMSSLIAYDFCSSS